jgi:hypothetical protein
MTLVIPTQVGIQGSVAIAMGLGSRLRGITGEVCGRR